VRRGILIAGLAALALAGCGGDEREAAAVPQPPRGDWGPTEPGSGERKRPAAPELQEPAAAVAQSLAAGATGVVGVEGAVGVRPRALDVSADGTLERLRWDTWEGATAEGRGRLRLRDCDPTCASGGLDYADATIRLSQPRLCGRATYFDKAEVVLDDGPRPTAYVRAPC
jgi:hypothetical protein